MSEQRKPGERWRVTFEGKIDRDGDLAVSSGCSLFYLSQARFRYATSTERLPDSEPEWQYDDICEDAEGNRWRRLCYDTWMPFSRHSSALSDSAMRRPLTPVMLGGRLMSEIEGGETK